MTKEGKPFFDTNVLIYALASNDRRTSTAEALLAKGGVVGVQNLNEFASVASRKMKMSWHDIEQALSAIRTLCPSPIPLDIKIHEAAVEIAGRHQYQIYEALVIAAAISARCLTLYSEDLQHGQVIGGVTVQNPFLTAPR
jgi:predicted nucleic acid-binding protein